MTRSAGDGAGGILTLSCVDSTLNREVYVKQTNQLFAFTAQKPWEVEAFLQYTEANTNEANIAFGVARLGLRAAMISHACSKGLWAFAAMADMRIM